MTRKIEKTNVHSDAKDHHEHKERELNAIRFKSLALAIAAVCIVAIAVPTCSFAQAPTNWVNWTGIETVGGVTKYVGQMVVPRTGGGSTTVIVKYTPPTQQVGELNFVGIAFAQFSSTQAGNYIHDYWRQGPSGVLGRNPARSPYTSSKVVNIPDGGGAASDQWDIIALRYAGTNTLEFTDASTGFPISIASPVFAYVSLNGNGYGFDQDFDILSFGDGIVRDQGYFGVGTSFKSVATVNGATQYQLLGTGEPHGALQFRGSFSTVTWQSLSSEFWNGFTIGVAQLAADVPIANAGPDQTVTATSSNGASVQLSGSVSGSTKTPFTFTWTGLFGTASGQNPTVALPVGTNTITLKVTDGAGASDTDTVVVTVLPAPDTTPPVIAAPANITVEATSAAGAAVTFSATAVDNFDGPVAVSCTPASGSTFPLGATSVTCSASDAHHNTATKSFNVTVVDTTPPVITVPANQVREATSAAGAVATFAATATDNVGVTSLTYSNASGSTFPIGTTTVTVTARDAAGNTSTGAFTITVRDTTPPTLTVPVNQVREATSAAGAVATFTATATDIVGVTSLTYSSASGSTFPIGTTTVTVTAKDAAGNTSTGSFTVTVRDTTPPTLTVPANQIQEATSAAGAVATFTATATDIVGVTSLTYSSASGSTFPLGTTTVTVTARDAAGNTSTGSFTITVRDTTPPALTVPANQIQEATSAAGAVAMFAASATDAVTASPTITYSQASGSTFPLGTTTVTVTAKDAAGNASTGAFTIKVQDTTPPVISSVTPSSATLWPPNHQMVPITLNAVATDAVGVSSLKIIGVTSSEPDNGLGDGDTPNDIQITGNLTLNLRAERSGKGNGRVYTITVEAKDAANNAATKTVTVSVPKSQGGK